MSEKTEVVDEKTEVVDEKTEVVDETHELAGEANVAVEAHALVRVHIVKNFRLNRDDNTSFDFTTTGTNCGEPGYYNVTESDANHWYLQCFTDDPPAPVPPPPGTPEYVAAEQRAQSRRKLIDAALDQEEQDAASQKRQSRSDRLKNALGNSYQPKV